MYSASSRWIFARQSNRFSGSISRGSAFASAGDATFLRRVYLDTLGTLPTAKEARDFLADASAVIVNLVPDKNGVVKVPRKQLGGPDSTNIAPGVMDARFYDPRTSDLHATVKPGVNKITLTVERAPRR